MRVAIREGSSDRDRGSDGALHEQTLGHSAAVEVEKKGWQHGSTAITRSRNKARERERSLEEKRLTMIDSTG